jgi:hypothetical protein
MVSEIIPARDVLIYVRPVFQGQIITDPSAPPEHGGWAASAKTLGS